MRTCRFVCCPCGLRVNMHHLCVCNCHQKRDSCISTDLARRLPCIARRDSSSLCNPALNDLLARLHSQRSCHCQLKVQVLISKSVRDNMQCNAHANILLQPCNPYRKAGTAASSGTQQHAARSARRQQQNAQCLRAEPSRSEAWHLWRVRHGVLCHACAAFKVHTKIA